VFSQCKLFYCYNAFAFGYTFFCISCNLNHISLVVTANLTGHVEKVTLESFELLKVLGTGGKSFLCLSNNLKNFICW